MTSPLLAIQRAVYTRLSGQLAVPVYDAVPRAQRAPYIVIGDKTEQAARSMGRAPGANATLTLTVVSDQQGDAEALTIAGAVRTVMEGSTLVMAGGHLTVDMMYIGGETRRTDDSRMVILRYRFHTEPTT